MKFSICFSILTSFHFSSIPRSKGPFQEVGVYFKRDMFMETDNVEAGVLNVITHIQGHMISTLKLLLPLLLFP